jgi:hypothetical protein
MSRMPCHHGASPALQGLAEELCSLAGLSFDELRARYRRLYRRAAPAGLSKDLIGRLVAHRLQELHLGKLDARPGDPSAYQDRLGADART